MPAVPPAWDFDFSEDFLLADGLETVVLTRQKPNGDYADAIDVRAIREQPNRRSAAGMMEAADLVFHLYGPDVGPDGISHGDRLRDSTGDRWDAKEATLAGVADQWRVPCTLLPYDPDGDGP